MASTILLLQCMLLGVTAPIAPRPHSIIAGLSASTAANVNMLPLIKSTVTPLAADTVNVPECFQKTAMYEPIDMIGHVPVYKSTVTECQKLCATTPNCKYFTYYSALGTCNLEDAWAILRLDRWGFIAGPAKCMDPTNETNTSVKAENISIMTKFRSSATAHTISTTSLPNTTRPEVAQQDFCCMEVTSASDVCSTCKENKRASPNSFCGTSKTNCQKGCRKVWCMMKSAVNPIGIDGVSNKTNLLRLGALTNSSVSNASANQCPACAPQAHASPDIVIALWEHDLCKVKILAKSLAVHDPGHLFGDVHFMWVSKRPSLEYQEPLDNIKRILSGTHVVKIIDFSQQLNDHPIEGWYAQQIFKLKIASVVSSDYYIVLDAKNTFIRDVKLNMFFTKCNQAKINGEYHHDSIPGLHAHWYAASAHVLHVDAPKEGYWPASITPLVMHRQTVLDMLATMGEDSSTNLSSGPLYRAITNRSVSGYAATEFTLYLVFAHSRPDFKCIHNVERQDSYNLNDMWAVTLWRGVPLQSNLDNCEKIMSGQEVPLMFGAQTSALQGIPVGQQDQAINHIIKIYQQAKVYPYSIPIDEFVHCILGPLGEDTTTSTAVPTMVATIESPQPPATTVNEFCCTATTDPNNFCGACYPGARAGPDNYCGLSKARCESCKKVWCSETVLLDPIVNEQNQAIMIMKKHALHDNGNLDVEPAHWLIIGRTGAGLALLATFVAVLIATRRTHSCFSNLAYGAREVRFDDQPTNAQPHSALIVAVEEQAHGRVDSDGESGLNLE